MLDKSLAWAMPTGLAARAAFSGRRPPEPGTPCGNRAIQRLSRGTAPTTGSTAGAPMSESGGRTARRAAPRARDPPGACPFCPPRGGAAG